MTYIYRHTSTALRSGAGLVALTHTKVVKLEDNHKLIKYITPFGTHCMCNLQ